MSANDPPREATKPSGLAQALSLRAVSSWSEATGLATRHQAVRPDHELGWESNARALTSQRHKMQRPLVVRGEGPGAWPSRARHPVTWDEVTSSCCTRGGTRGGVAMAATVSRIVGCATPSRRARGGTRSETLMLPLVRAFRKQGFSAVLSAAAECFVGSLLSARILPPEDVFVERGVTVSHEVIQLWCQTSGLDYAPRLRRRRGRLGDTVALGRVLST